MEIQFSGRSVDVKATIDGVDPRVAREGRTDGSRAGDWIAVHVEDDRRLEVGFEEVSREVVGRDGSDHVIDCGSRVA